MTERFRNFINGKWVESRTGRWFEDKNPANTGDVIGEFPKSDAADVDTAVQAAKAALPGWSRTPGPKRGELLFRLGRVMEERKEDLARTLTRENGKILDEGRGDVQEAIDTAYYAGGEGRRLFGITTPSELGDKWAMTVRQPVGVCGLISPWNFPIAIPTWKMFPALISGCTVILKPASDTPLCAVKLAQVCEAAGIPPGVVNVVHGGGAEAGTALARHKDVRLISFTGSSAVGRELASICGQDLKRCSLELGGKNAQIVMDDADMDLALKGALWGAFATAGQRCTATSRLILHRAIKGAFLERLVEAARKLKIGDGLKAGTEMGPLINEARRTEVASYVEIGKGEGARLVSGGAAHKAGECARGYFFEPTIFDGVTPAMRIFREEIFGPVLSVVTVGDLDEAIATMNDSSYGLSSSIYTKDVRAAFQAMERIECGIVYVNGPTIGAESHLPFGGMKDTGNGHREASHTVYDVYNEWKTIYVDYSGRLQRAQIDNQPA
ncbi:MAG: aldehyde dehydrogenase family protein [Planctomycetes bacterium]|nr:aldehyde dehydrogenase family protein [Planctomycetota bacterium]